MEPKIAFIYGTSKTHKTSRLFGEAISKKSYSIPYNWNTRLSTMVGLMRTIYYAKTIPKYDAYIASNPIALVCCCVKKQIFHEKCKIIHRVNDNIYNSDSHGKVNKTMFKWIHKNVDLFISCSSLITKSIKSINPNANIKLVQEFLLDPEYLKVKPDLKSNNFILVGSVEKKDCKGTLKSAKAIKESKINKNSKFFILGPNCNQDIYNKLTKFDFVKLEGFQDPKEYFTKCTYYIQPGTFDAASNSIIEAMAAGLIPITNEFVGNSDMVKEVSPDLISKKNTTKDIARIILELNKLSLKEKEKLSNKCKVIAKKYNQEKQLNKLKKEVNLYLKSL